MSSVIVLIDTVDGNPCAGTELSIAAASCIGQPIGLCTSDLNPNHYATLASWGLHRLIVVPESADSGGRNLDSDLIASAAAGILQGENCHAVVAEPTTLLREVAGRLAGRRRSTIVTGVSAICMNPRGLFLTCTIDGGLRTADVTISAGGTILFVHATASFQARRKYDDLIVETSLIERRRHIRTVDARRDQVAPDLGATSIQSARLVVSGGRGLGSAEGYTQLRLLADVLGGALGASRAAVESGWAPQASLVGQTGAIVAPDVYLAFGISGAPQHLAGIRASRAIIAVNSDPRAPLMEQADIAGIADARKTVEGILERFGAPYLPN